MKQFTYQKELVSGPKLERTPIFSNGDVVAEVYSQDDARLFCASTVLLSILNRLQNSVRYRHADMDVIALEARNAIASVESQGK